MSHFSRIFELIFTRFWITLFLFSELACLPKVSQIKTPNVNTSSIVIPVSSNINLNGSPYLPRNLWAWRNPADIINDSVARDAFFSFSALHNVKTVYVSVRTFLESYATSSRETSTEANLPIFLNLAAARGMDVQFLIGNGGSYLSAVEASANYPTMRLLTTNAKNFVSTLLGAKPTAIHWDVEPQGNSDWSTNRQGYVQRLVNAYQSTRAILQNTGIAQAADVPHWWDSSTYGATSCDPQNNTLFPTYQNQIGVQCLIRVLDQIDIMDYRDSSSLSISQALDEISFASSVRNFNSKVTAVNIGQETDSNSDLTLTFYDELRNSALGMKAMEVQLQLIQNRFNNSLGFGGNGLESRFNASNPSLSSYLYPSNRGTGISIHHYDAYSESSVIQNFP